MAVSDKYPISIKWIIDRFKCIKPQINAKVSAYGPFQSRYYIFFMRISSSGLFYYIMLQLRVHNMVNPQREWPKMVDIFK